MKTEKKSITFAEFSEAQKKRAAEFFDKDNNSIPHWTTATAGEGFEAIEAMAKLFAKLCDTTKRSNNSEITEELRKQMAKEDADILTYLFVRAERFGYDLEAVAIAKFNEVSDRIKSKIKLEESL